MASILNFYFKIGGENFFPSTANFARFLPEYRLRGKRAALTLGQRARKAASEHTLVRGLVDTASLTGDGASAAGGIGPRVFV